MWVVLGGKSIPPSHSHASKQASKQRNEIVVKLLTTVSKPLGHSARVEGNDERHDSAVSAAPRQRPHSIHHHTTTLYERRVRSCRAAQCVNRRSHVVGNRNQQPKMIHSVPSEWTNLAGGPRFELFIPPFFFPRFARARACVHGQGHVPHLRRLQPNIASHALRSHVHTAVGLELPVPTYTLHCRSDRPWCPACRSACLPTDLPAVSVRACRQAIHVPMTGVSENRWNLHNSIREAQRAAGIHRDSVLVNYDMCPLGGVTSHRDRSRPR